MQVQTYSYLLHTLSAMVELKFPKEKEETGV